MTEKNEMIFGVRAVIEAIQAGKEIDKILVKRDIQSELSKELFAELKGRMIPVQRVPVERINRITRKNHQGVIAFISAITYQKTEDIVPYLFEQGKNPLLIMLDGITDVRNFGAIARTCECAGIDAIIIPAKNSVSVNADAMKTSAGALHTLPVCREQSLTETIKFLKNSGFKIVAATEKGDYDYTKANYKDPVCIIMGAEDTGVPYEHLSLCDEWIKIPLLGKIESLNVSVAAGIPIDAIEEIIDTEEITEEMAKTGEFFGLKIKGDSMTPLICDGDIVIVRRQNDAENGDIVIATINGDEATCKRLRKYQGGIELIAINPSYSPFEFNNQDIIEKPVRIIGKVVESRRKF